MMNSRDISITKVNPRRDQQLKLITNKISKAIIKSQATKGNTGPDGFNQTFKEILQLILLKLFKKKRREGPLSKSLYEAVSL